MLLKRVLAFFVAFTMLMPVLTHAQPAPIDVQSESAVLMDALTGQVLFAKNESERRSPASLTKIMTLVVAFDALKNGRVKLNDKVMASEEACKLGGTQVYAKPGEVFPLGEWLLAVAVGSANDGAVVVAEHIGGTEKRFVQMMNEKAKALGMKDSSFINSHGLDEEGHFTSALDMAILGRYATTFPDLLKMTGTYQTTFRDGTFGLDNRNKLVRFYTGCDGLKTGHTDKAKYCLVATASRGGESRFVSVVMGAPNSEVRFAEARKLLDYGFANFASVVLAKKGDVLGRVRVYGGTKPDIAAVVAEDAGVTLPKGEEVGTEKKAVLREDLKAPLRKGARVGDLVLTREGKELARFPLFAAEDVNKASPLNIMWRFIKDITTLNW